MSKILSDLELERIRAKLREALGRDLTPEESRYLGLSNQILPGGGHKPKAKAATVQRNS